MNRPPPSPTKQAANLIDTTNLGYRNSGVAIRLKLHCTRLYNRVLTTNGNSELTTFWQHRGGSVPALLQSADVAMLAAQPNMPDRNQGQNIKSSSFMSIVRCCEEK